MNRDEPAPPRWADAILRWLVRPANRETISGDLLEEFRVSRYPVRGTIAANSWYLKQVFSILWRLIRPCVLALVVMQVVFSVLLLHDPPDANTAAFVVFKSLWYGSPVQAPGISLFDAAIYAWAAYHAFRQSQLLKTGILAGAATSFIGFAALFVAIAFGSPHLLLLPFAQPFTCVILLTLLSTAVGYGVVFGAVGGVIGWCASAIAPREPSIS